MNEMKFGNIVQSVLRTIARRFTTSQLRYFTLRGNTGAVEKYTPKIFPRTVRYITASRTLLTKLQKINMYQYFLNENSQLQQQARDMISELKTVIKRLEYHPEKINNVLSPYSYPTMMKT